MKTCSHCGAADIPDAAKVCGLCGTRFDAAPQPIVEAPTQATALAPVPIGTPEDDQGTSATDDDDPSDPLPTPEPAPVQSGPVLTPDPASVQSGPVLTPDPAPVQSGPVLTPEPAPVQSGPVLTPEPAPVQSGPSPGRWSGARIERTALLLAAACVAAGTQFPWFGFITRRGGTGGVSASNAFDLSIPTGVDFQFDVGLARSAPSGVLSLGALLLVIAVVIAAVAARPDRFRLGTRLLGVLLVVFAIGGPLPDRRLGLSYRVPVLGKGEWLVLIGGVIVLGARWLANADPPRRIPGVGAAAVAMSAVAGWGSFFYFGNAPPMQIPLYEVWSWGDYGYWVRDITVGLVLLALAIVGALAIRFDKRGVARTVGIVVLIVGVGLAVRMVYEQASGIGSVLNVGDVWSALRRFDLPALFACAGGAGLLWWTGGDRPSAEVAP